MNHRPASCVFLNCNTATLQRRGHHAGAEAGVRSWYSTSAKLRPLTFAHFATFCTAFSVAPAQSGLNDTEKLLSISHTCSVGFANPTALNMSICNAAKSRSTSNRAKSLVSHYKCSYSMRLDSEIQPSGKGIVLQQSINAQGRAIIRKVLRK